ncbi:hypothetical protein SBA7_140009 [Candidatus Sulfotelmatobacter sp. SbA7]|nr:hypothetical protein SBA7_140009 [Candidatus Sulfotelmatobacter sp. SbA7]
MQNDTNIQSKRPKQRHFAGVWRGARGVLGVWYPHSGKTPLATFSVKVADFGANGRGQAVV